MTPKGSSLITKSNIFKRLYHDSKERNSKKKSYLIGSRNYSQSGSKIKSKQTSSYPAYRNVRINFSIFAYI